MEFYLFGELREVEVLDKSELQDILKKAKELKSDISTI